MTEKNNNENDQMIQPDKSSASAETGDTLVRADMENDSGSECAGKPGLISVCTSFVKKYDAEIRLSILFLYVISLVIAAVIELLEH